MLFTSFDGKEIFVHEWKNVENVAGVVQIAHGMEEHAARYDRFAKELNAQGYVVVADDHRGHGDTDPETLGYCPGDMYKSTIEDMAGLAGYYQEKYPGVPYILFGFSYGSFLTQGFVETHSDLLDGAVIAGSARQNGLAVRAGLCLSKIGCAFKGESAPAVFVGNMVFGGYRKKFPDREFLSVDAANNEAYHSDPFCGVTSSYNFYRGFFRGMKGLYTKKAAKGLDKNLPLLLIAGAEDAVGGRKGMTKLYKFYQKQEIVDVGMYLIENSRHEFLNEEVNREEAKSQIIPFIRRITRRNR